MREGRRSRHGRREREDDETKGMKYEGLEEEKGREREGKNEIRK